MNIPRRGNLSEEITVDGIAYTRAQIYAALENTGLPFLERQIDETLVRSLKMKAPRITMKRNSGTESKTRNSRSAAKRSKSRNAEREDKTNGEGTVKL